MAGDPGQFLRFAADHVALLRDLFDHPEGISDVVLREFVMRHRSEADPTPQHIESKLLELRILEEAPGGDARWELTQPVRGLLRFLYREHRLTSSRVIQAYLDDLASAGGALDAAGGDNDAVAARHAVMTVAALVDRVRQDSRDNRDGISLTVMRIKAEAGRRSAQERFRTINHLWKEFIEPLRELIDVRQSMEFALSGLDLKIAAAIRSFPLHESLRTELMRTRDRVVRLRRDAAADFRAALSEIHPLYRQLRRESGLARGAAIALRRLDREGLSSLGLEQRLGVPVWRVENLIPTVSLESHWAGLTGYEPGRRPAIARPSTTVRAPFLDVPGMIEELRKERPIPDALAWLVRHCDSYSLRDVLRVYARLHNGEAGPPTFGSEDQRYRHGPWVLQTRPMRLEATA